MAPKEKAKELVEKFEYNGVMIDDIRMNEEDAKQCALICVDEILKSYNALEHYPENLRDYWQEVKQELN